MFSIEFVLYRFVNASPSSLSPSLPFPLLHSLPPSSSLFIEHLWFWNLFSSIINFFLKKSIERRNDLRAHDETVSRLGSHIFIYEKLFLRLFSHIFIYVKLFETFFTYIYICETFWDFDHIYLYMWNFFKTLITYIYICETFSRLWSRIFI